jgi:UDP-2-acetamido-3-amino-2,3-dideoxy-glucuronate N-acetyltransferase
MRNATINVAVVGVGYWGRNLARNFRELGALSVLCDADAAAEARCRTDYPGVAFHRDYRAVLDDPGVTAIALATPATMHHDMARAALESGKDVLVEKPLAVEVPHGEELVELAAAKGRILMVGHILRYHPAILTLQRLIHDGALGRIHYLYSNRLNIGKIRTEENILWSFAPHDISVMLALLGEAPRRVVCRGGAYVNRETVDVTLSHFEFPSGVQAHILVSWLHPFKEQRLVVVGSETMAVFDDTADDKLVLYPHRVEWRNRVPTAVRARGEAVALEDTEPLRAECRHFLECVRTESVPVSDGAEGLRVLRVLDACQRSLLGGGVVTDPAGRGRDTPAPAVFVHETARVDEGAEIGAGTKIWHYCHVAAGARIGAAVTIGQNVYVDGTALIGSNVKIQNNVSVYAGVVIEDDVFLGPSCVLTNVTNPRAQVNRHALYEPTRLRRGCTVGANATVVCGVTIGRYAFVGAGAVVTRDVPDYALVVGNPARRIGWMSRHGHRLGPGPDGVMQCPESGHRYRETEPGVLRCLDLDDEAPLPADLRTGTRSYRQIRMEVGR